LGKMKAAASSAAESTKLTAKKTQLDMTISADRDKIAGLKKDFGVKVWDTCAAGGDYKPIFNEFAPKVKELEDKIAATKKEVDALNKTHEKPADAPASS